MVIGH